MKKQFIILFTLLTFSISAWAQKEYKVSKSSGRLNLNVNGAVVEGYNGNEIVFNIVNGKEEPVDERAKGLKPLSGSGFTDNTGLGLDVSVNGQDINVNSVVKEQSGILQIKVPQNVKISFTNNSTLYSSELLLRDLKNEIEVSATHNKIKLENNSGPMNIKAIYGSVDASFTNEVKGPISIISVYGLVDISMPVSTKANIELGTSYGKLFAAEDFKIAVDKNRAQNKNQNDRGRTNVTGFEGTDRTKNITDNAATTVSGANIETVTLRRSDNAGENIKGTVNGGGVDLIFKSNYNNVYLRQK
ncbi:DUF4097 family beta strand repeat-containing protein [Pedobacter antarcticus]|uniref:DUF4097 domain-containing protein n=2 Tax=Pedobacter antarcticus TaxID=34086 RepID=A0A081PDF2_9SPHI|nr:DUF4097 family beta strand repeat-containing protein [Pedobacter antarcticus]KEQ28725.1 hypothetical protein N180_04865 [Pedobacter antarcticus 4BY]SDL68356.1 hypothetical protein SAMN04488084_10294 [Pedobacter antarcticus]SFE89807.1 hypothetical protein SAMN03003324_01713 [Pedobacter antarcticus]